MLLEGGAGVVRAISQTQITPTGILAMAYENKSCLVSLIARANDSGDFIVEEYRIPQCLVC